MGTGSLQACKPLRTTRQPILPATNWHRSGQSEQRGRYGRRPDEHCNALYRAANGNMVVVGQYVYFERNKRSIARSGSHRKAAQGCCLSSAECWPACPQLVKLPAAVSCHRTTVLIR
jgi:hypothetical protein